MPRSEGPFLETALEASAATKRLKPGLQTGASRLTAEEAKTGIKPGGGEDQPSDTEDEGDAGRITSQVVRWLGKTAHHAGCDGEGAPALGHRLHQTTLMQWVSGSEVPQVSDPSSQPSHRSRAQIILRDGEGSTEVHVSARRDREPRLVVSLDEVQKIERRQHGR